MRTSQEMSGMVQADSPRADVDARYRRELDAISRMLLGTCVTGHRWNRASGGSLTFEAGTRQKMFKPSRAIPSKSDSTSYRRSWNFY